MEEIKKFDGGVAVDDRGSVSFVNGFDFQNVKRFYMVENFSAGVIRAFHGHLREGKYVFVPQGSIILAAVFLESIENPGKDSRVFRFVLSGQKPEIVYIPPRFANGFKSLEEETRVLFFSTSTLEESKGDDYRFPYDYWGKEVWEVENR